MKRWNKRSCVLAALPLDIFICQLQKLNSEDTSISERLKCETVQMMDAHSSGSKSKKAEHRSWPGVITALFDEKGVDCSWAEPFVGTLLMCAQKKRENSSLCVYSLPKT